MSQAQFKKRLKSLMQRQENQICSDCTERKPTWASLIVPPPGSPPGSLPIGAFCCLECSGSHRRLGVHISFVRSVNLDSWKEKEVLAMENGGNKKVNAIFEARLVQSGHRKPNNHADGPTRERFIRDKYERRKYYDPAVLQAWESEEESSEDEQPVARSSGRSSSRPTVAAPRPPSEAARRRIESRQARMGGVPATSAAPVRVAAPAPAPPQVDLLDFGAFESTPAPAPPAAAPVPATAAPAAGPNVDLFANMTMNGPTPATPAPTPNKPAAQKSHAEILAMFGSPSQPQQQMPTNNNNSMMMMNNNMNAGGINMMQQPQQAQMNQMFMQQQRPAQMNPMMMQQQPQVQQMNPMFQQPNMMMMQQPQQQQPVQMNPMMMMQQQQQQQQQYANPMMMQQQQGMMNSQQQQGGMGMMMSQQQPQSSTPSDGFGFPDAAMGSGPPIAVQAGSGGGVSGGAADNDPFAQFGVNHFRS